MPLAGHSAPRPGLWAALLLCVLGSCRPAPEVSLPLYERGELPLLTGPGAPLSGLEPTLRAEDPLDRYVALSALVALRRSAGAFEALEVELEAAIQAETHPVLLPLLHLWYGDNALYAGDLPAALVRYRAAIAEAAYVTFLGRSLRSEILAQRAIALKGLGRWEEGIDDLSRAAAFAERPRALSLLRRGADMAEAEGDIRRARALRAQAERQAVPKADPEEIEAAGAGPRRLGRRGGLPRMEDLDLLAPWEQGVPQRAGGVTDGAGAYVGYALRGFARGSAKALCGKGLTGYYYGAGSHSKSWAGGRDFYAIDFTRGRSEGSRIGNASFGIQVRAAAAGVVLDAHYGTRTHWGVRNRGPAPQANRVDILHIRPERRDLDAALEGLEPGSRLRTLHGVISQSLHLAGLEAPCGEGGCIPFPALVSFGQLLLGGSPIGYEDSSGLSMIDHLHFSVMVPCTAREPRCSAPESDLTHVSVPLRLEGRALREGDVGVCILSSNRFTLGEEGADALSPLLSTAP